LPQILTQKNRSPPRDFQGVACLKSPSLSGCPLQKGGETTKKQPLLILMVFPLFEGGAAIAAGGFHSQNPTKKPPPSNRTRAVLLTIFTKFWL